MPTHGVARASLPPAQRVDGRQMAALEGGLSDLVLPAAALRGVSARKRGQLAALLGALPPLAANAERIVDVGAGPGTHLRQKLALHRHAALLRSGGERSSSANPATWPEHREIKASRRGQSFGKST